LKTVSAIIIAALYSSSALWADSLVGLWTFSNPNDLGADSSGNGYNLTLEGNGTPGFDSTALGGQGAVVLNGSEWFAATTFPGLIPTGNSPYTIAAWINPGSAPNDYGIVGWGDYSSSNGTNALRTATTDVGDASTGVDNYWWFNDVTDSANVFNSQWYFVVATYDGTTRTVYIDPATGGPSVSDTPGTANVQAENFAIGLACPFCNTGDQTDGQTFTGELSDVSVYSGALTQAEAISLQESASTPEPGTLLTLVSALLLLWCGRCAIRQMPV